MKIQLIGSKLVEGQGVGSRSVVANAVVAKTAEEAIANAKDGMVLVVPTTDKEFYASYRKSKCLSG